MLSRLSSKLSRFTCGYSSSSPPPVDDDDDERDDSAVPFLCGRRSPRHRSTRTKDPCSAAAASCPRRVLADDDDEADEKKVTEGGKADGEERLATPALATPPRSPELRGEGEEVGLPCLAFPSLDGYRVFSLAKKCMCDDGGLACRRRYVASPYGGKVFVTDLNWRYSSHLVDPFTGERTPLPDLPIPFSETEPMPCAADGDEPRAGTTTTSRDDCFAWDWSPWGAMISRGDTASRARHRAPSSPAWAPVTDIGDRAAFVTRTHGFTVGVDRVPGGEHAAAVRRNHAYVPLHCVLKDRMGRIVFNHKVGVVDLKNPMPPAALPLRQGEINSCLVHRKAGEPQWIIRNDDVMYRR
uniref:Uncharacterized protein n=1 Tax=Oryza brachyantha TaxID=4533 RepID=J3MR24_ORYBR